MPNITVSHQRPEGEVKAEMQMKEAMSELIRISLENDELVYEIGSLLLQLGGIARNYRLEAERRRAMV